MQTVQTLYIRKRMFQKNHNRLQGFTSYEPWSKHRIGCIRVAECDGIIFVSSSLVSTEDHPKFEARIANELADAKWQYCAESFSAILGKGVLGNTKLPVYICRNKLGLLPTPIIEFDFEHILDLMHILQPLRSKWLFNDGELTTLEVQLRTIIPTNAKLNIASVMYKEAGK